MITLVHGSDILTSRNYFVSKKDENSLTFDAETLNPIELAQSIEGSGLFEIKTKKKIFIENLFTRKGVKNQTAVSEILKNSKDAEIYIWADKEIGLKSLSGFPKFDNQNFKIPQNIWLFLDSIRPNSKNNLLLFRKALLGNEPEWIFAMILRQFRLLIGIKNETNENIDEVKRLVPWQREKIRRQASLFSMEKLTDIYKKLYKIDKSQKTGTTSMTLTQNIDILLLEI